MRKIPRNPEKFDVLELFSEMAIKYEYDLTDPDSQASFIEHVRQSFEKNKSNKISLYGKRVESLFAFVAGALGKVQLLKQEDAGSMYQTGDDILAPDYRLIFNDGTQLLVEVKNCHISTKNQRFRIRKKYLDKLQRYSEINKLDLKIAIYFSSFNFWCLLSPSVFHADGENLSIDITNALMKSEMSTLGDCMVATTPNLELHLLANPEEAKDVSSSGEYEFTIRNVRVYCSGNEVIDEQEKRIAFYLMRYGNWVESNNEAIIHDNKLFGSKITYSPEHIEEEQGFTSLGNLSTMVSNGFKALTVKNGEISALTLGIDPSSFSALIPDNYTSENLPLWRFMQVQKY